MPVHVVSLQASPQIASVSRYCTKWTQVPDVGALYGALGAWNPDPTRRPLLVDNDRMMKALAPHIAELQRRFRIVEPLAQAAQFHG